MKRRNVFKALGLLTLFPLSIFKEQSIKQNSSAFPVSIIQKRVNEIYTKQGPQKANFMFIRFHSEDAEKLLTENIVKQLEEFDKEKLKRYAEQTINSNYYGKVKLND